ncbi:MAG: hypothetical protein COX62_05910, partial [Deltaproteobacteria bacterium CG_4_10_14_0_2_um_filter_43_8]
NDVRERIQIDRKMISEEEFAKNTTLICHSREIGSLERVTGIPACAGTTARLTYFEFLTAVAFLYFAERCVDVAVLEVGLGGRFDATNVVDPVVSVITRIGMDHQHYLGDTIEKIAFEKAGIIKTGVPVVTVVQEPKVMDVLRRISDEKGVMLHVVSPQEVKYKLGLLGRHQYENAALALRASELVLEVTDHRSLITDNLSEAFASTRWPGRLEVLGTHTFLGKVCAPGAQVILDGAHNPNGAEALARFMKEELTDKHKIVILGIMADKDIEGVIKPLVEAADEVVLTRPSASRAAGTELLCKIVNSEIGKFGNTEKQSEFANSRIREFPNISSAIEGTIKTMRGNSVLIIAGSLYTVAEARRYYEDSSKKA